jgi:universal stress protein A
MNNQKTLEVAELDVTTQQTDGRNEIASTLSPDVRMSGEEEHAELASTVLELKNILVPIDFSKISQEALEYAVPFAKQFGAKITLIHAVEPLPYTPNTSNVLLDDIFPVKVMKKLLQNLARDTVDPELLNKVLVGMGTAFEVIINTARDSNIDLIIITTHGYTGLRHVFMGSTAERVVRHAPCPVLVVRRRGCACS